MAVQSYRNGFRSEPLDATQDVGEEVSRDRDLRKLDCDVAPMAHDLRADLDQPLASVG